MSFATDKWFKHLHEEILIEGLADIGLDEDIQQEIMAKLPEASEKSRVWVGNSWKSLKGPRLSSYGWFEYLSSKIYTERGKTFQTPQEEGGYNLVLNLLSVYTMQSVAKWPKAKRQFIKAVRKGGFSEEQAKQVLLDFKNLEMRCWRWFSSRIENVLTTLNQNPNNYEMIKSIPPGDYEEAEDVCLDYQLTREDPEQIIHTFEDGSYWYDLQTYQCEMEGNRMGHCGTDQRGTLYSLRKQDAGKKASKSYITIAYNADERTIYQIKGRQNTCPPRELWGHIETFVEIMGAEKLEETGEYSNDPYDFQELGTYLDDATGIQFVGSIEKRLQEFTEEVETFERDFERSDYAALAEREGLYVELDEYGDGDAPTWSDTLNSIAAELPFNVDEKLFFTLYNREDYEDSVGIDIEEEMLEIIKNEDRNDIFGGNYFSEPHIYLLKADSAKEAMTKCDNFRSTFDTTPKKLLEGEKSYIVAWAIDDAYTEYAKSFSFPTEADSYEEWLSGVEDLVDDLGDSVDAIEDLLISRKLIGANQIKAFKAKIDQEFNNFAVATTRSRKGEYDIMATGLLFKTTAAEMETIVDLGFLNDFYSTGSGYYTSEQFKTYVITKLKQKEAQAVQFAKNQMKLNFGEKYEQKIESLWDKINSSDTIKKSFYNQIFVGFQPSVPRKVSNPRPAQSVERDSAFGYKIEVILNNQTIEFFGPFLEYYDNNFELVTGAIDYALKTMISSKAKNYKKQSDSDTNLSLQETPLDVRVYEIDFVMSYPLGQGFEMTDIHNIIRAIPDVTTVRTVGETKKTQGNRTVSLQRLKFALQGQSPRNEWVKKVLLPQIRKISPAIRLHKVQRANIVSGDKQKLEELYYQTSMRQSPGRTTPVPAIQSLIDDWVQGGVMYDMPTNINLTRYSVMMPVEELKHLMCRVPRKHGHHFDAGYQKFIENGPRDPIYLAIGKNGRAKITGNEDDLRYAIKAGVEEVPVFISYQRQV
jgi:hypothetical protein